MKANPSSPWCNTKVIARSGFETTPFIWKKNLYRIENFHAFETIPGAPHDYRFHEDGFRIRHVKSDRIISIPLLNHYFATATTYENKIYVFAGDYEQNLPWWHIKKLDLIISDDLVSWSKPQAVLEADAQECLFNNSVTYDGHRFVMLYESNDPNYIPFTFKFAQSYDLIHWEKLDNAIYGRQKYVGGPALYYVSGFYYLLYLNQLKDGWETNICRSTDLITWEEAAENRPFLSPDRNHETNPVSFPGVMEINASDLEMIEYEKKVYGWWMGGNQQTCSDLKVSEFHGTMKELFEMFF